MRRTIGALEGLIGGLDGDADVVGDGVVVGEGTQFPKEFLGVRRRVGARQFLGDLANAGDRWPPSVKGIPRGDYDRGELAPVNSTGETHE